MRETPQKIPLQRPQPRNIISQMPQGRKRKIAKRYPSGKIIPRAQDPRAPTAYHRLLSIASDAALGTPLGRLWWERRITDREYQAGLHVGEAWRRWRALAGLRSEPRSPALERVSAGAPAEPDAEAYRRVRERWLRVAEALDGLPLSQRRAVVELCVDERWPGDVTAAIAGLRALVGMV